MHGNAWHIGPPFQLPPLQDQAVGPGAGVFFWWRDDAKVLATWEMRLPWLWTENLGIAHIDIRWILREDDVRNTVQ